MNNLLVTKFDEKWCYRETEFLAEEAAYKESLFSVGNGYIGVRGYFDEGYGDSIPNTTSSAFLNGVYESLPIEYDESAYGFAKNCHRIIDVPRHRFLIEIDGNEFSLSTGKVSNYQRVLDFKTGVLTRELTWDAPNGKTLRLKFERTALYQQQNIMASRVTAVALNFSGSITIKSVLSAEYAVFEDDDDPRRGGTVPHENWLRSESNQQSEVSQYIYQAKNSKIKVGISMISKTDAQAVQHKKEIDNCLVDDYSLLLEKESPISVTAYINYSDSRKNAPIPFELENSKNCEAACKISFDEIISQQRLALDEFWKHSDIEIESEDGSQYPTRFSLFHLFQSTGRDGLSSISAKGVTGAGYDGHYFWDSETYIFPFWLFSHPNIAKQLLQYRVNTLDSARQRAREMGHSKGALFAWRTIGGEECSSYFPAGSAQYHINADIAYAAKSYFEATEDNEFLKQGLAEMVIDTSRIWMDLGSFSNNLDGKFGIFCVTGPDEYTALVNNNFYTNKMAQTHLSFAVYLTKHLSNDDLNYWNSLKAKLSLTDTEINSWQNAATNMYFCFDEEKQIFAQDDTFLDKPIWDFENTPADKYPLLLHYHPLVIYRHQVSKQADTLLALLLEGEEENIDLKKRCYDYYEPLNTHDSTLSTCVHGVFASEVGYQEQAYEYFMKTLRLDLDNDHHNTFYGVHTAAMGGIWMGIAQGFGGLRYSQNKLKFNPHLPKQWKSLRFNITYKGRSLNIQIREDQTIYSLNSGDDIEIQHKGKTLLIGADSPVIITQ